MLPPLTPLLSTVDCPHGCTGLGGRGIGGGGISAAVGGGLGVRAAVGVSYTRCPIYRKSYRGAAVGGGLGVTAAVGVGAVSGYPMS